MQQNAPAHKSHVFMQTILDLGFQLLEHLPFSPDMASSDYHVFLQLKESLKSHKFSFNEEMIEAVEAWFVEQDKNFFLKGLEAVQLCCNKSIQLRGKYKTL